MARPTPAEEPTPPPVIRTQDARTRVARRHVRRRTIHARLIIAGLAASAVIVVVVVVLLAGSARPPTHPEITAAQLQWARIRGGREIMYDRRGRMLYTLGWWAWLHEDKSRDYPSRGEISPDSPLPEDPFTVRNWERFGRDHCRNAFPAIFASDPGSADEPIEGSIFAPARAAQEEMPRDTLGEIEDWWRPICGSLRNNWEDVETRRGLLGDFERHKTRFVGRRVVLRTSVHFGHEIDGVKYIELVQPVNELVHFRPKTPPPPGLGSQHAWSVFLVVGRDVDAGVANRMLRGLEVHISASLDSMETVTPDWRPTFSSPFPALTVSFSNVKFERLLSSPLDPRQPPGGGGIF